MFGVDNYRWLLIAVCIPLNLFHGWKAAATAAIAIFLWAVLLDPFREVTAAQPPGRASLPQEPPA
jgi:hypothetical protein